MEAYRGIFEVGPNPAPPPVPDRTFGDVSAGISDDPNQPNIAISSVSTPEPDGPAVGTSPQEISP